MKIQGIQQNIAITKFCGKKNEDRKDYSTVSISTNSTALPNDIEISDSFAKISEDNCYRKNLLKSAGISDSSYKINSIMGPNETRKILKELDKNEDYFIASPENINSGKYRANLHIHTNASDGFYSPKELLNDAAIYADKVNEKIGKPFVIAITDHDTIDSYSEIINEVASNHEKYKNLKIILGMESTTFDEVKGKPMQFHMLIYNIDPSDKKFNDFLKSEREKKDELSKVVIKDINKQYNEIFDKGDLFSFEEYTNMYPTMKKGLISSHNYIRNYAMTKFLLEEVVPKMELLNEYFDETNPERDTKLEMKKIKEFQYKDSHNNRAYTALSGLTNYYSDAAKVDSKEFANNLHSQAKKSDNVMKFIKNVNPKLYNHRNIADRNFYVNIEEVCEALSNQPKATLGIAHPLNTVIDSANIDAYENVLYASAKTNKPKESQSEQYINDFYETFKAKGKDKAKFSERYYQSYSTKKTDRQTPLNMQKCIDNLSEELDLLRTGGYDSHRKTIFSRY